MKTGIWWKDFAVLTPRLICMFNDNQNNRARTPASWRNADNDAAQHLYGNGDVAKALLIAKANSPYAAQQRALLPSMTP